MRSRFRGLRRRLRVRSLRGRVLLAALSLVVAALTVVNVVALVTVRNTLLSAIDRQLQAIPTASPFGSSQLPPDTPATDQAGPFLSNIVVIRLDADTGQQINQIVGPLLDKAPKPDLTSVVALVKSGKVTDHLATVGAIDHSSYDYRIRVVPPSGQSGSVIVAAVSLSTTHGTLIKVALIDGLVSLAVIIALLAAGFSVMRLGLRPLRDVESAAQRITAGDLSIRARHTDEPSEVGSLARSFNSMIEQIEEAFGARHDSEERLRIFVADASHELRTPLTSIRAYAELFRRGALPGSAEGVVALDRIETEAIRMGALIDELLVLARLDEHPALERDSVDLYRLCSQAVRDIEPIAAGHNVVLHRPPPQVAPVIGDATSLRRLFDNLLRNALVHTPAGTTVEISLAREGSMTLLTVTDDGPGMSPAVADNIFERFYRPEHGRTRGSAGSGLGLSIVKATVLGHNGSVEVHTAPGRGARFAVRLPADLTSSGSTRRM